MRALLVLLSCVPRGRREPAVLVASSAMLAGKLHWPPTRPSPVHDLVFSTSDLAEGESQ